ncbi:MAG: ketol-acid reductoisomerase, partial [Chloroflexi bacterium]
MKMFYDKDCPPKLGERVAILGYGSQGRAHALNLKESGEDVTVGLYAGSRSRDRAEADGVKVADVAEAVAGATVVMVLTPDTGQARLYRDAIEPSLKDGAMLMFAHGFAIHFGQIKPKASVDVTMVAPKAPGHLVRSTYQDGQGT